MLVYNDSVYIKSVPYAACEMHTLLAYSFQKTKPVFIINSYRKNGGFPPIFPSYLSIGGGRRRLVHGNYKIGHWKKKPYKY